MALTDGATAASCSKAMPIQFQKTRKVQTDNQTLSLIQDNFSKTIDDLGNVPVVNSLILPNVSLSAGLNMVPHKLGRPWIGALVVAQTGPASIGFDQAQNQNKALTLPAVASGDCTVTLLVF